MDKNKISRITIANINFWMCTAFLILKFMGELKLPLYYLKAGSTLIFYEKIRH